MKVEISYMFDASELGGQNLVTFEELYDLKNPEEPVKVAILCGHDGRRAGLYHVCVQENYRKHGIGQKLVERCLEALKAEKISKVNLIAFKQNEIGNRFWQSLGWKYCDNVNYYEYVLNEENITVFNP